jgi:hypothetical protein
LVNQRMAEASTALTDETLAALCILVTVQKIMGEYDEMKIHLRGLLQMVHIRGGLESLQGGNMRGLLIGEILWGVLYSLSRVECCLCLRQQLLFSRKLTPKQV